MIINCCEVWHDGGRLLDIEIDIRFNKEKILVGLFVLKCFYVKFQHRL